MDICYGTSVSFHHDGGPGSGNFGHAGRPGKRGCSAPGGSNGGNASSAKGCNSNASNDEPYAAMMTKERAKEVHQQLWNRINSYYEVTEFKRMAPEETRRSVYVNVNEPLGYVKSQVGWEMYREKVITSEERKFCEKIGYNLTKRDTEIAKYFESIETDRVHEEWKSEYARAVAKSFDPQNGNDYAKKMENYFGARRRIDNAYKKQEEALRLKQEALKSKYKKDIAELNANKGW